MFFSEEKNQKTFIQALRAILEQINDPQDFARARRSPGTTLATHEIGRMLTASL
jgi:hypothetical protein